MPRGSGHRFSEKEHERAMRIKHSYLKSGAGEEKAERIAWATINKQKKHGIGSLKKK